ncbi:alpha/beta fold hydrolase [bacterium]|nr:alpha/beta fold hydrolase [bacterium]
MENGIRRSPETTVKANGIDIVYDTFGDPHATPLLLVNGLGYQLTHWDDEFCGQLAQRGYRVIRFDNRDVGLSTDFNEKGIPNLGTMTAALMKGESVEAPYHLKDMANDAVGLLDALQIEAAHIVGMSMGGMITQMIAIHHPARALTITSVMSTTGDPTLPPPTPAAMEILMTPAPSEREANIQRSVKVAQILAGPGYPINEEQIRIRAAKVFDRKFNPAGYARQYAAILASGDRTEQLRCLTIPTLIIHGDGDPLVPYAAGLATLKAIPGAKMETIKGMGHDLPPEAWKQIINAIAVHAVQS